MAIGYQEIQPAVVIHVKKSSAPSNVGIARLADAGGPAHVVETLFSQIAIQRVGLFCEMGDKVAEASAMVVIAEIYAHGAHFHPVAAARRASEHAAVGERAVLIIVIQIARNRLIRDKMAFPAVIGVIGPQHSKTV